MRGVLSIGLYFGALGSLLSFFFWLFLGLANAAPTSPKNLPVLPLYKVIQIKTNGSNLNIRSGPGAEFAVIGTARHMEKLLECDQDIGWVRVRNDKRIGWVSDGFVERVSVELKEFSIDCAGKKLSLVPTGKDIKKKTRTFFNFTSSFRNGLSSYPTLNHYLSMRTNGQLLFLGPSLLVLTCILYFLGRQLKRHAKLRVQNENYGVHDRLAKFFKFSRYFLYGIFALSFLVFMAIAPPRYHILQADITKLENKKGELITVDLAAEQKAIRIIHIFPLWPTTTRVVMISKDKKTKWSLKPKAELSYKKKINPKNLVSRWRLMQGIPEIIWLIFIGWLTIKCSDLRRDAVDFSHAIRENNFKAYRNFLNCKGYSTTIKRTKFYRQRAGLQVRLRLNKYIIFLEAVTQRAKNAPLRDWFLTVIKSVSGEKPHNVKVSFIRNLAKESWRDQMLAIHQNLKAQLKTADVTSIEKIRSYEEGVRHKLEYKNVHDISEVINPKFYQALETSISSTLSSIFQYLFSDELITFGGTKGSEKLDIAYNVRSTQAMFSKTGSDTSELERDWYAGMEFDWVIGAFKKSVRSGQIKLTTGPKQNIKTAKTDRHYVYIAMGASSFGALGKAFLNNIGLTGDSSDWYDSVKDGKSASLAQDNMEAIIKECSEESIEQILTEHTQEINEFVSSLHAHFDVAADQVLNNILAAGMDLGDFGIDLG